MAGSISRNKEEIKMKNGILKISLSIGIIIALILGGLFLNKRGKSISADISDIFNEAKEIASQGSRTEQGRNVQSLISMYSFISSPKVIDVNTFDQPQGIGLNSPIIIQFDKPVKRQQLQYTITPEAYGEWKFDDPLVEDHLFRALVFVPAIDFKPNTQYQIDIQNIISLIGIDIPSNYSFNFKTQEANLIEIDNTEPNITSLNIVVDWQDHPLSCEAASLKMALASKGIYVSEENIMEKIGYDPTLKKGNIWGNPNEAFVGDINGKMCSTGYGVHWGPVAKAANNWCQAEAFSGWSLQNLINEIELGNPVVVWGVLPVKSLHNCAWNTSNGQSIKTFRETHVRLATGFIGDPKNPSKIILTDPLSGKLYWSPSYFLKNWESSGYSGVVIR
jgi:uncharacterized protein YvpB